MLSKMREAVGLGGALLDGPLLDDAVLSAATGGFAAEFAKES
jgi:hypothetical protein